MIGVPVNAQTISAFVASCATVLFFFVWTVLTLWGLSYSMGLVDD